MTKKELMEENEHMKKYLRQISKWGPGQGFGFTQLALVALKEYPYNK